MQKRFAEAVALFLSLLIFAVPAWGWGSDGHKIVAVIAADNLTPAARSHAASILGVSADRVAPAMEEASVRPDSEFREQDRATAPWHFVDICLQDTRNDIEKHCPGGNCVTDKIDEYAARLKNGNYDRWGASGDLAFLIHFVGDVHQPLHAADDADLGGNCVLVESEPRAENLHAAWDTAIVRRLERSVDSGTPEATALKLEETYKAEKSSDVWVPGHTDDIAWESTQIARTDIYAALRLPVEPCDTPPLVCRNKPEVDLTPAYMDRADAIAGYQLARAGFRLASLLNEMWIAPVALNGANATAASAGAPASSSRGEPGQIVGNLRSKIYAWPGCGSYDMMAPHNRVVFPSRAAAEAAGYRAARNCP